MSETDDIKVELSQIPEHVKDELASATLKAVTEFLKQPGAREFLDKEKALRKARKGSQ